MARPLRIEYPGAFYHITGKGREGKRVFSSHADYEEFIKCLREAKEKFRVTVHCYVLMGTHYHLIVETPHANLSRFMHHLASSYTTYFNNKRKQAGHLFQGRYKAILIDAEAYLPELSRYLHLTPVTARLVKQPEDYPHSSYRVYILKERQDLLSTDLILSMVSANRETARRKYRTFIEAGIGKKLDNPVRNVYGQVIAGSSSFIKRVLEKTVRMHRPSKDASYKKSLRQTSDVGRIIATISSHFKIPRKRVSTTKSVHRNLAIYFAKKYTGLTNNEIGMRFGNITYSAVTKTCARLAELARKDERLRTQLSELEKKLT